MFTQKNIITLSVALAIILGNVTTVLAQESSGPTSGPLREPPMEDTVGPRELPPPSGGPKTYSGEVRKDIRADVRNIRDDVKNGSTTREEARESSKARLEEGRAAISAEREKARAEIELKREKLKTEAARKRAEHFAKIGEIYMKRYLAAYDRLINIKDRIVAHIEKIEANGQNVSAAKTELDKATPILAKALASIDELKTSLTNVANNPEDATLKTISQEKSEIAKTSLKEAHAALINVIENLKPKKPSGTASSSSSTI